MLTRKEMKRRAKTSVKKHYVLLLAVCLIAAFLGSEFAGSLNFVKQYNHIEEDMGMGTEEQASLSTGATTGVYHYSAFDNIVSALVGNLEDGEKSAQEMTNEAVEATKSGKTNPVLGRSRGVFASLVNGIDSGSLIINIISAVRNIGVSQNVVLAVFILIAMLLSVGVWFFLVNMYQAVSRRIFLESRTYEKVTIQRFLVFLRVKKWQKVSGTMFMKYLFQTLWNLTVIGGIIKHYSYYMVPYIVAENPDIHWKDAITLSRKMMYGHKWECFVYEISFILWNLLGSVTLGISNVLFVNAYKVAAFCEYYAELRRIAKDNHLDGSDLMNDTYLFEVADESVLREAYADVIAMEAMPEEELPLKGFRGFLARVFGVTIFNRKDEQKYEAWEERKLKIASMKAIVNGRSYPSRLSVIPESQKNSRVEHIHYLRHYSIPSLILLYFSFSFIGWLWEVSLHLITDGEFVNRGVLHGPWLPIYGTGSILILVLLNVFRKKPVAEFISAIIVCGCVEYFTAYYLEMTHGGQKWWDYSGYFLNLHGRICAEGLLVFGIGGLAIVYAAAPLLDNFLRRIKFSILIPVCVILLGIFAADQTYSKKHPNTGKGITDYNGASVDELTDDGIYYADRNVTEIIYRG
ncbi:DUF975 family protein [Frisingicoccus sp.]|uniref:DUF975 family protein n=1 Tax=Frisingicoccus sp. TaxID=1918627 RepID=UPI002E765E9B|nr:DUF975 family protein [Frisingicoccus sp.]MEE0752983.1 DUF975 family protein [Frisingicoccus sp.]